MAKNEEVNGKEEVKNPKDAKMVRTLFLVLFPSLLIAGNFTSGILPGIALKAALIFFQFVILHSVLRDYYSYIN